MMNFGVLICLLLAGCVTGHPQSFTTANKELNQLIFNDLNVDSSRSTVKSGIYASLSPDFFNFLTHSVLNILIHRFDMIDIPDVEQDVDVPYLGMVSVKLYGWCWCFCSW